jgi:hypothetical protein
MLRNIFLRFVDQFCRLASLNGRQDGVGLAETLGRFDCLLRWFGRWLNERGGLRFREEPFCFQLGYAFFALFAFSAVFELSLFFGLTIHVPEKLADYSEALFFFDDFGAGREGTEFGVDDDLFDKRGLRDVVVFVAPGAGGCGFAGQIGARDLEAVEEETGAFGVDFVGGYATKDLADGGLYGGAILRVGKVEGGAASAALARIFYWATGGVVVVAELFVSEAGAGAAASVGEDVAA